MSDTTHEVLQAALLWWTSRRPIGWSLDWHLSNPTVSTVDAEEHTLALAVARAIEEGQLAPPARYVLTTGDRRDIINETV